MRWIVMSLMLLAGGCAVPPTPPTPVEPTHERDPVTGRGFWMYVPSTYRAERPSPLIVTCHGTPPYDVANHHIREWQWYGEKNNCIVIAPELIATDGIFGDGPTAGMLNDERFILSMVSYLGYHYNIDRANVMITGFSGGGFPTYFIGLRHPDLFTCIVARNCNFSRSNIEGWWTSEALRTPILIYYGEFDPNVIQSQSGDAIAYLRAHQFSVETQIVPKTGHERRPDIAMKFFHDNWKPPRPSLQR